MVIGEMTMHMKQLLLSTAAGLTVAAAAWAVPVQAQTLAGQVTSQEGPMEGVLVTAKKAGSTIAYTVVSDAQGHYSFPSSKIDSGEYALRIRAVGFDLDSAGKDRSEE